MGAMSDEQLVLPFPADVLADVRRFLGDLRKELPQLFPRAKGRARRVPFMGRELAVRVVADSESESTVLREEDGALLILRSPADAAHPHDLLRQWYREKAREIFVSRTTHFAEVMGLKFGRISIKDQRSLWGSCSREGNLNFNWRVVMAPPEALDYLVIHELAHLKEMNHSRRFWAVVAEHCPAWREHRRWLRDHSRRLKTSVRRAR